jgi:hypothetical protein
MEGRIQLAFLPSPVRFAPHPGTPARLDGWQRHVESAQGSMSSPCGGPRRIGAVLDARRSEDGLEACGVPQPAGAKALPPPLERMHTDPPPVRVHVSGAAADGLRIWLGIDGKPEVITQRAAAVIGELRRAFHGSGQRVSSVVCNGGDLYPALAAPAVAACVSRSSTNLWKDHP